RKRWGLIGLELWSMPRDGAEQVFRLALQIPGVERGILVGIDLGFALGELLQANEKDRAGVIAPGGGAETGAIDRSGNARAGRGVVDPERGVFRTAFGNPDSDLAAIERGQEIVDRVRLAAIGGAQLRHVDELSLTLVVLDHQVEIVRSRC